MQMAYSLAEKGKGRASPNPYVGAVVLNKDIIVGCGYHERPGRPHAEAIALEMAGVRARGGTAYITLEPCTHYGRTPPCVNSILQAHLKRAVVSALDPNPIVYGKGIKKMRDAGIQVSVGLLKEKNAQLNESYLKYITQKMPFVTVKAAVSLDSKTATKNLFSQWISSPKTREYVHLLRGEHDALMVGISTLIKDDPLLTIRHPNWKEKTLTRIILDSHLRFPLNAKMLGTLAQGKIVVFTLKQAPSKKVNALQKRGVEIVALSRSPSGIDLKEALAWMGQREIASVLVEGGGRLLTSLLEEKLADKLFLTISPKLIGGTKAPSFFQGKGVGLIKDALTLRAARTFQIDGDIIIEGYF